jgi:hypothetical protein
LRYISNDVFLTQAARHRRQNTSSHELLELVVVAFWQELYFFITGSWPFKALDFPEKNPIFLTVEKYTKKNLILEYFRAGKRNINDLAYLVHTTTSYVASVLQQAGELSGYFDLYTDGGAPMNVYDAQLHGQLGFKTVERARKSVAVLEAFYQQADDERDRAAQHHALVQALTLFDRARWCGKFEQAKLFRKWLSGKMLMESERAVKMAS